jgi:protein involved in polysaccharide export with SLBB domain
MKSFLLPVMLVWILALSCRAERRRPPSATDEPFFTVFGQVQRQGKYEYPVAGELTISQAIELAHGFTPQALRTDVHIIRKVKGEAKPLDLRVNLEAVLERKEMKQDMVILPNDVIIVKEKKATNGSDAEGKKPEPPPDQKEAPKAKP